MLRKLRFIALGSEPLIEKDEFRPMELLRAFHKPEVLFLADFFHCCQRQSSLTLTGQGDESFKYLSGF